MKIINNHHHVQTEASDLWTIDHNMGCQPIVQAFVYVGEELTAIIPNRVEFATLNQVKIHFTQTFTGEARLS